MGYGTGETIESAEIVLSARIMLAGPNRAESRFPILMMDSDRTGFQGPAWEGLNVRASADLLVASRGRQTLGASPTRNQTRLAHAGISPAVIATPKKNGIGTSARAKIWGSETVRSCHRVHPPPAVWRPLVYSTLIHMIYDIHPPYPFCFSPHARRSTFPPPPWRDRIS